MANFDTAIATYGTEVMPTFDHQNIDKTMNVTASLPVAYPNLFPALTLPIMYDDIEGSHDEVDPNAEPVPVSVLYTQRIWDIGNTCWVYYTSGALNSTPLSHTTSPQHSGNLLGGSHEILYQSVKLVED